MCREPKHLSLECQRERQNGLWYSNRLGPRGRRPRYALRPGRAEDYSAFRVLWAEDVRNGRRDCVPEDAWLRRQLRDFNWGARCRAVEDARGIQGFVLVIDRATPEGVIARLEAAARGDGVRYELLRWGARLARAAGAATIQVWWPRNLDAAGLMELGFSPVRPFWRMDRADLEDVLDVPLAAGYRLVESFVPEAAADAYNSAFAEHWRFTPVDPEHLPIGKRAWDLSLVAQAPDGKPAAVLWGGVEEFDPDTRPQPVGIVGVVGTVPAHRRRGLGSSLTVEALRRFRLSRARSASLYVDGMNPTHAYDLYRRLGFEVAYQYEVFEAQNRG